VRASKSTALAGKALNACLAAIEVYNKPMFAYRCEAFSILMLNAWELLLKAKILKENGNRLPSIYARKRITRSNGALGRRMIVKKTRAGNSQTIEVVRAAKTARAYSDGITDACLDNIFLLKEIRDGAVHFSVKEDGLALAMHSIGTAALKNFMTALSRWFGMDITGYDFFLMPLAFWGPQSIATSVVADLSNESTVAFKSYLESRIARYPEDSGAGYSVAIGVELRFVKSKDADALDVRISNDPDAPAVQLTEVDLSLRYPYSHKSVLDKCKSRYSNFKQNNHFNDLMRAIKGNQKYCFEKRLVPVNPASPKTYIYSEALFLYLDNNYVKR